MICRKCQSAGPARPRRHHAKCLLRGIGTSRRRTERLIANAWWSLADVRADMRLAAGAEHWNAGQVADAVLGRFYVVVGQWPKDLRWWLQQRMRGDVRAAFDRLDRMSPLFRGPPLRPLPPIGPLLLARPWASPVTPILRLSSMWALYRVPAYARNQTVFRMARVDRKPVARVMTPRSVVSPLVQMIHDDYRLCLFATTRGRIRVFLPAGVEPDDAVAETIEPIVDLIDTAHIPGTEQEVGRWALARLPWFRTHVRAAVVARQPHLERWLETPGDPLRRVVSADRAIACEASETIAAMRAVLAEGGQ